MLSRRIVSVLALSSALGTTSLAGADAAGTPYGTACASPFHDAATITSVTPYKVTQTNLRRSSTRLEGAVITVAAQPGLTREWLQREVSDPAALAQDGCPMSVHQRLGPRDVDRRRLRNHREQHRPGRRAGRSCAVLRRSPPP